ASPHPAGAGESNRATSRLNSRSSARPTGSPPIPIHTRARAPGPAGPPAPALPPSTALLLPWLQFLKGWSLRQTRGDSKEYLGLDEVRIAGLLGLSMDRLAAYQQGVRPHRWPPRFVVATFLLPLHDNSCRCREPSRMS